MRATMDILNSKNAMLGRNMNVRKLLKRKIHQHGDKPFIVFVDKDLKETSIPCEFSLLIFSKGYLSQRLYLFPIMFYYAFCL